MHETRSGEHSTDSISIIIIIIIIIINNDVMGSLNSDIKSITGAKRM